MNKELSYNQSKEVILAGKAILTFLSPTGKHFTYKIVKCKSKEGLFFVSALCGPDNNTMYKYFGVVLQTVNNGIVKNEYKLGTKTKIAGDSQIVKSFSWVFSKLFDNTLNGIKIYHEGKCCKCGKKLTVPESIENGIGPE